jgi:hypothetical protein
MTLNYDVNPNTNSNGWVIGAPVVSAICDVTNTAYVELLDAIGGTTVGSDSSGLVANVEKDIVDLSTAYPTSSRELRQLRVTCASGNYTSAGGSEKYNTCIQWVRPTNVPVYTSFVLQDDTGTTMGNPTYIPKSGYLYLSGVRGFYHPIVWSGSGEMAFAVTSILILAGNVRLCEINFNAGSLASKHMHEIYGNTLDRIMSASGTITYGDGSHVPAYLTVVGQNTSEGVNMSWGVRVRYEDKDVPDTARTFTAIITSETGLETRASINFTQKVKSVPKVDRISLESTQSSGVTVMGNIIHPVAITNVKYSLDRRIPVLDFRFDTLGVNAIYQEESGFYGTNINASTGSYAGPFIGSQCIACHGYPAFSVNPMYFNALDGGVDAWVKPASWSNGSHTVFRIQRQYGSVPQGGTGAPAVGQDIFELKYVYSGGTNCKLTGTITDSFGVVHTAEYTYGTFVASNWHHCRMTWKTGLSGGSELKVYANGTVGSTAITTGSIAVGLFPSVDMNSIFTDTVQTAADIWSPIYVGASMYLGQFRMYDSTPTVDSSYYSASSAPGFNNAPSFDTSTGTFRFDVPVANNDIKILRVKAVDSINNQLPPQTLNSSLGKPVLLRGIYSGVVVNDETVNRFRLIDAGGQFADYTFLNNPQSFNITHAETVFETTSITGKKNLSTFNKPAVDVSMGFTKARRALILELVNRANSNNSFFLIDHNDEVYFGKLMISSFEEIVATVPSRYNLELVLKGQGGYYDYKLG